MVAMPINHFSASSKMGNRLLLDVGFQVVTGFLILTQS